MPTQQAAALSDPQKQALRWLARLHDAKCSETEKQDFSNWLALTPGNAEAYQQVQQFWEQTGELQGMLSNRLETARGFVKTTQSRHRRRSTMLVIGFVVVGFTISKPELCLKLTSQHYQTAKGQQISVDLSDGSRIELNTDSELRVADLFGWRKAWLERGEAWFDIRHNADQLFEVFAGLGRIQDIGTQFNVITDQNQTTVVVEEGEVAISTPKTDAKRLVANQQSSFNDSGQLSGITNTDVTTGGAWRKGMLVFKHQSLSEVLKQLSRYHQVEFEINDVKLQNMTFSGRFSTTDLDESLNTLSSGLGVKITQLTPERISIKAGK